ncbi:SusD/RagB family nutrient-binding outer membrane lipoprotein [Hymenobacter terrestris]|uniref:SusD/RagB family nutrient-binding outer membrane lipoprotein n=1 Tax=Hymenobacter terrestris TaxID=2748310 RepID=A0ABX2Q2B6_9BACT|nr:SusD/RagB family nutrient-binding outer membrane lipoprotein [Hymenobacter terrestris]NVO85083.1 SusD/RagB family nutrient-binding outer membrane lipoprotein [Hymenobacter terrestris]
MKYPQYIGLALTGIIAFGAVGCQDFLDVNQNPNNPESVPPSVLLTSTAISTGFSVGNEIGRITSLLVQHVAGAANQAAAADVYNIRGGLDNQWQGELYAGTLENSQTMIDIAERSNSPAYAGIGKLLKAYNFALTTDLWGDIPYSEALRGLNNLQPRFDRQEDIYKGAEGIQSLDALIKEGLADLAKPSDLMPSGTDDPIYAGDLQKWARMGNTLRLKLANTMSRREPALAATIINEVIAANSAILTNANDFEVPFGGGIGNRNPIYAFGDASNGQRPLDLFLSQRLLDSMAAKNDPRLPIYFTTTRTPVLPTTGGPPAVNVSGTRTTIPGPTAGTFLTFTGLQNGTVAPRPATADRSRYNAFIAGASGDAPIRVLTNTQRLFIMAESALILNTSTGGSSVQGLYQAAIRASMTKAGITDQAVTDYFAANPSVAILRGSTTQRLNQIMTQKWISWVGNGYEAYNDYRRTGFPRLALAQNAEGDDPNVLPKRFVYPASELSGNVVNAPNPAPGTTVPVWWDVD